MYSKEEDIAFTSEQTTDIRTYVSNDGPSTSTSTCNQSQHVPVESLQDQTQSDDGQRMWCDLEVKQLREMFPDCPENILKEASERYVSLDSALDFIMGNSIEVVSMYIQNIYCVAFSLCFRHGLELLCMNFRILKVILGSIHAFLFRKIQNANVKIFVH